MKEYKGYHIDGVYFRSKEDVDKHIKESLINEYKVRCRVMNRLQKEVGGWEAVDAAAWVDDVAYRLHKEYGMTWQELNEIEATA